MNEKKVINVVAIDCKPEVEEKFVHWYDEVHIPILLKFKGLLSVKRYKISNSSPPGYPRQLTNMSSTIIGIRCL